MTDSASVIRALGISQADVLGFSIGGYIAQTLTLRHPELVRRLVLVGTGPRAGEFEGQDPKIYKVAGQDPEITKDGYLFLFFEPTETSQQAGKDFWARRHQRTVDVDPPSSMQVAKAQAVAMDKWREQVGERWSELKTIQQPTLVVNGSHDIMVPTINSYILQQHIPGAQLIDLPRLRARLAVPVPRAVRQPRVPVPGQRTRLRLTGAAASRSPSRHWSPGDRLLARTRSRRWSGLRPCWAARPNGNKVRTGLVGAA